MTLKYSPYRQHSSSPDQAASRWWRPLTNGWGILGLIIFIGLVMRLIDGLGHWPTQQPVSLSSEQAATVHAAQPDQSSPRFEPGEAGASR
jgi:hypothetical protein